MSTPKVFKAVHILNRGRKTEVQPGTLFQPKAAEREEFLALGAIVEANEAEIALFEKMGDKIVEAEDVEEALSPLDHDGDGKAGGSLKGEQSTRAKGAAKKADSDGDLVG